MWRPWKYLIVDPADDEGCIVSFHTIDGDNIFNVRVFGGRAHATSIADLICAAPSLLQCSKDVIQNLGYNAGWSTKELYQAIKNAEGN